MVILHLHLVSCSTFFYATVYLYIERGQHDKQKKQITNDWIHTQMTIWRWVKSLGTSLSSRLPYHILGNILYDTSIISPLRGNKTHFCWLNPLKGWGYARILYSSYSMFFNVHFQTQPCHHPCIISSWLYIPLKKQEHHYYTTHIISPAEKAHHARFANLSNCILVLTRAGTKASKLED